MMKRTLSLIMALVLCLVLCACGNDETKNTEPATQPSNPTATNATLPDTIPPQEPTIAPGQPELLNTLISAADILADYDYPSGFRFCLFTNDRTLDLEGIDAVRWVYETAQELAPEFTDAEKILTNFTVLENKLLSMYPWYEDALGNIWDRNVTYFDYEADGSLIHQKNDTYEILSPPDDYEANYGITEYTYDDSGTLITVRYYTDETKEKIRCVIDYGYDENGFLITERYLDASGKEFNIVYHNNEKGLPFRADGYPYLRNFDPTPGTAYFTYDDQDRLISISIESDHFYNSFGRLTRDYVYDETGNLISIRRYHQDIYDNPNQGGGYQDVEVWNYYYDESGTPLRHTYTDYVVCDDDGTPLKDDIITYTVDYTYGTYYCYTPEE